MLKKMIIVATISVASLLAFAGPTMAGWGGDDGYDPLYWNGPAGFGDYNILFRPGGRYARPRFRRSNPKSCSRLLRQYRQLRSAGALRRYQRCRARY